MKIQASFPLIAWMLLANCTPDNPGSTLIIQNQDSTIPMQDISLINQFGDSLGIKSENTYELKGSNLREGYHTLMIGEHPTHLFLTQGDTLYVKIEREEINFSGKGEAINSYLTRKYSPAYNWYSNYYKTKQTGSKTIYFRDHYIKKLSDELTALTAHPEFVEDESSELKYTYYNQLLVDKIMLETSPDTDPSILDDLREIMSTKLDDIDKLNRSQAFIEVVARILVAQNRVKELPAYYDKISPSIFKTLFLESLVSALHKELQFAEDDYAKSQKIASFINSRQPGDSIGYHIFNLYNKFHEAEGQVAQFAYEDTQGNFVSLESFRGTYVLIDFWATWCKNCIKEFPYLHKLEKQFEGEPIEFVGISVDKLAAKDHWKSMVAQKGLKNTQLLAPFQGYPDKDVIDDAFMQLAYVNAYYLGIPHYTLIDPEGRIVDTFFYRPSNPKAATYLARLFR